jgi:hypothetical protein
MVNPRRDESGELEKAETWLGICGLSSEASNFVLQLLLFNLRGVGVWNRAGSTLVPPPGRLYLRFWLGSGDISYF